MMGVKAPMDQQYPGLKEMSQLNNQSYERMQRVEKRRLVENGVEQAQVHINDENLPTDFVSPDETGNQMADKLQNGNKQNVVGAP